MYYYLILDWFENSVHDIDVTSIVFRFVQSSLYFVSWRLAATNPSPQFFGFYAIIYGTASVYSLDRLQSAKQPASAFAEKRKAPSSFLQLSALSVNFVSFNSSFATHEYISLYSSISIFRTPLVTRVFPWFHSRSSFAIFQRSCPHSIFARQLVTRLVAIQLGFLFCHFLTRMQQRERM